MTAQPVHPSHPQPRVPHTIGGISEALRGGARRAQFFAEVLAAEQGGELDRVMTDWWGRAMLGSDPDRDRSHAAAEARHAADNQLRGHRAAPPCQRRSDAR